MKNEKTYKKVALIGVIAYIVMAVVLLVLMYSHSLIGDPVQIFFGTGMDLSILAFILIGVVQIVLICLGARVLPALVSTGKVIFCILLILALSRYTFSNAWASSGSGEGIASNYLVFYVSYIFAALLLLSYIYDVGTTIRFRRSLSEGRD